MTDKISDAERDLRESAELRPIPKRRQVNRAVLEECEKRGVKLRARHRLRALNAVFIVTKFIDDDTVKAIRENYGHNCTLQIKYLVRIL